MPGQNSQVNENDQRIRFDYTNLMADSIGPEHGLQKSELEAGAELVQKATRSIDQKRKSGLLEWMDLPYAHESTRQITALAGKLQSHVDNFVVLGIGGSALGNIAVHNALTHPFHNLLPASERGGRPRVFVLDNIDPDFISGFLDYLEKVGDPSRTVFNVITKSGSTAETMSQLLIFRKLLSERLGAGFADHLIATTDPDKGDLRKLAQAEGYETLPIPANVGGRFSVLSSVGLLSAAVAGVDIAKLLEGAAYADKICQSGDLWSNPAAINALAQYLLYGKGKTVSVYMPYSQSLRYVADWFRQLWAESLGKERSITGEVVNVGPTPLAALGVTDQHSMLQLFQEGPYDKIINFVTVERFGKQVEIPEPSAALSSMSYLGGHTLNELILAEQRGVELALTAVSRPNCRHIVPEVNAFTVGQLLYLLEVQTAYAGEFFGINAYDQPGVEGGKNATYALMGRGGYEAERQKIESLLGKKSEFVV